MPAKPAWHAHIDRIAAELEALPGPWVTRGVVEFLLGVGPRRAQQMMAACAVERIGSSLVADRRLFLDHLRALAGGEAGQFELARRRKVARSIDTLRRAWIAGPKLLVEAPVSVVNQRLDRLPAGVELAPGCITIRFDRPAEALEKMLALAMAIGKDLDHFATMTAAPGAA